jgi:hypothetical protein
MNTFVYINTMYFTTQTVKYDSSKLNFQLVKLIVKHFIYESI